MYPVNWILNNMKHSILKNNNLNVQLILHNSNILFLVAPTEIKSYICSCVVLIKLNVFIKYVDKLSACEIFVLLLQIYYSSKLISILLYFKPKNTDTNIITQFNHISVHSIMIFDILAS